MGDSKINYTEENFKVYTSMVKYIRNLKMLDIHKRQISQKLYNMYVNLSSQNINLQKYIVNPKEFCDKLCENYIKNTSLYIVYLETVKKFSIVVAILALACDFILYKPLVTKYFVYLLLGALLISLILTYLKLYRSSKYGLNNESLKYKILYNTIALILIIPMFFIKENIKLNGSISLLFIGIISITIFFITTFIIKINRNNIDKKISCKNII